MDTTLKIHQGFCLWFVFVILSVTHLLAQPNVVGPIWQAKSRSEHQTEWATVRYTTNAGTGRVRVTTNSYIELGTGLNRRDPATGQ